MSNIHKKPMFLVNLITKKSISILSEYSVLSILTENSTSEILGRPAPMFAPHQGNKVSDFALSSIFNLP